AVSVAGTVVIVGSAAAFALGMIHWGGFLLLVSGLFDMVDGRVAREGGMSTPFGAFFDSTLDRVGESALFTGIGVFFLRGGVEPDRLTLALVACFVALAASLLVSCARAGAAGRSSRSRVGATLPERTLIVSAQVGRNVAPATGKLGVMLVGLGAVATTFIAGVENVRRGCALPIGSLTQLGTIRLGKRTEKR